MIPTRVENAFQVTGEDLERAINELTYLSHLNPRNGRIAYELARLHRLAGNMRLAQRIAQEAKLLSPWDDDVDMLVNEIGPPPMDDPDYNVTPSGKLSVGLPCRNSCA